MNKAALIVLTALLTYLVFFAGAVMNWAPYTVLIDTPAKTTRAALYDFQLHKQPYPGVYWGRPRDERRGVITNTPEKTHSGLTFFTSSLDQSAYLIDMQGEVVHHWALAFTDIWADPRHVAKIVPPHLHILSRAHLYPNGDILAIYTGIGSNPLGYGLARIDRDSNLVWKYDDAIHHDAETDDQGRIYTLSHRIRNTPFPGLDPVKAAPPLYEDFLVILDADGRLIREFSFYEMLAGAPAANVLAQLRSNPGADTPAGDTLHPNALELITAEVAQTGPLFQEGHLLVSFRNNSMLAIIDPDAGQITWAGFGPWRFQHDPRFLEDGSVMLFDNEGRVTGRDGRSRVLRVNIESGGILWRYTGTSEDPLYSPFHASVDPLPNRNVLITESLAGRLFEVTPQGEIVWDYRSPWRVDDNGTEKVPAFYRARRYAREDLTFLEK